MKEIKVRLIIIILIILIIIVSVGGTCLYLFTDALRSDEELFKKYAFQSVKNIVYVTDISEEENIVDELQEKDYTETMEMGLVYQESEDDESEEYIINETGSIKNSEDNSYRSLSISYDDTEILELDLNKQDETYGLRIANVVQQFVSIENESVSYFISSIGYDGSYLSETLQQVDISDIFTFSDEEIEKIISNYSNAIFAQDIDSSHFSSKSGVMITLNNGESITAKSYTLAITQNELDKIYTRVANQAIEDEIILSKLEQFDNKVKEIGINVKEGETLKERYIEYLQEIIDSIEYEGTDSTETDITIYVKDGVTYRTSIKREEYEYILDLDNLGGITMSLKTIKLTNEGTDETIISIGKSSEEYNNARTFLYENAEKKITAGTAYKNEEKGIEFSFYLNYYGEDITALELMSNDCYITYSDDIEIEEGYTERNNIILNNYDGNRVLSILEELKERTVTSLENTQSQINTKLLNNILLYIDEKEQEQEEEKQNNIEAQKTKFNNKFTIYEGDEIKYEYVIKLLETVGQNMSDYEVISGSKIRIYIEEGTENEEKTEEIEAAINDKNTYKIELNYSDDGYVESIDISINSDD